MITIVVPGRPIAKKRPRFARVGRGIRTYSDQQAEAKMFVSIAQKQVKKQFAGAVSVSCLFILPRPKSNYGTGKNRHKLKQTAPEHHTVKPDVDNLEKFVLDCLNRVAWRDDGQVVFTMSKKIYEDEKNNPCTIITVEGL